MLETDRYHKDPELEGIYVKRCKCGARPYIDRTAIHPSPKWIACNCGRVGESSLDKQEAINNWNTGKLEAYANTDQ
jgi:hypothetical protein